MIKKLLELGNRFASESDWKDFALTKFCLFSLGLIAGTEVADQYKKAAVGVSSLVFLAAYIPLMRKLFRIAAK